MKHTFFIYTALAALLLSFSACKKEARVPADATPTKEVADIFPDYRDIVIPPNIAPLNFMVRTAGDDFIVSLACGDATLVAAADAEGKFALDSVAWKGLLAAAKGKDISVSLYAKREGAWVAFPQWNLTVAEEPIDRYLSYRLIEPSYELYRAMGLYQRDLETFEQYVIYENNREFDNKENHCVNCHNFQNYSTDRMLFHVRANHGGTVFINGDKVEKLKMTTDSTMGNAVYPTWHPTLPIVVFSSNKTGQAFHLQNPNKIEVVDYGSDLLYYDAEAHTISNLLKSDDTFETFPCWAPDGRKLYYCSASMPMFRGLDDDAAMDSIMRYHTRAHYDLYSLTFDPDTRTFGKPELEVNLDAEGKSATVPRVSPDGKYLLYTVGGYGQFHIWHHDSDLWVKNLDTGETYPLEAANSDDVDSYHGWSSNGRWLVVASRRIDGNYSRPFIAYFDAEGHAHKAFLLPQEDPEHNVRLLQSYNVPEFSRNRVKLTPEQLRAAIYDDEVHAVKYAPLKK